MGNSPTDIIGGGNHKILNKTMINMNSEKGIYNLNQKDDSPQQIIEPLQGFGEIQAHQDRVFEGQCYLKTKTDRYKEHWSVLAGNELYCYRQKGDTDHRVMHSMIGTFIKEMPKEFSNSENSDLFPVKVVLPPNKSRILYFKSEAA